MLHKKLVASVVSIATGASLMAGLAVLPAQAATLGVGATVNANVSANLGTVIARGDTDISARITALNNLNTRVQAMKNASASEKSSITTEVQTENNNLTTLKAKIDADTDVTTARADDKSIFGSFRIYALVIPQGYIEASADRVTTITGLLSGISTKLQARISTDQSAGKDVTAMQSALADLNAKVADANTNSSAAVSGVASLTPDNGNQTQFDSNHTALVAARANIKTSTQDLVAARADAKTIIQDLKNLGINASASATSTVQ